MEVPDNIRNAFQRLSKLSTFVEFQTELVKCLREEVGDVEGFLQEFNSLRTNVEKVNFLYEKVQKYDLVKFSPDGKCDSSALRLKKKGDNAFANNDFIVALQNFTRVIMKGESKEMLSRGYANRSAALFKLQLYSDSLIDIERALQKGYPEEERRSLFFRKQKATEYLTAVPLKKFHEPLPVITEETSKIPGVSESVEIVMDESGRRRVYANKIISPGEVIAVEVPFTCDSSGVDVYHCHHCLSLCYNPIPCFFCCQVLYCNETCRDDAYKSYHEILCPLLNSLKNIVGGHASFLLALKMTILSQQNEVMTQLIDNIRSENNDETFSLALITAVIFNLVKNHSPKFSENQPEGFEDKFKNDMMVNLRLCGAYATEIDELVPNINTSEQNELLNFKSESIGCGLYPFYSLISHSCCVNAVVHHYGAIRVIRAVRTIKKTNEVLISFGPFYPQNSKAERQERLLSRYHFTCTCRACEEDWPQLDLQPYFVKNQGDLNLISRIRTGSVEVATRAIPRFISVIERLEHLEPHSDLILYHKMLSYCFDLLGNNRRIQ